MEKSQFEVTENKKNDSGRVDVVLVNTTGDKSSEPVSFITLNASEEEAADYNVGNIYNVVIEKQ